MVSLTLQKTVCRLPTYFIDLTETRRFFLNKKMEMHKKLTILGLINENKRILFGKFSDELTHDLKIKKWKEIAEQLTALGVFNKDWKYLRDTTWQNWRKRTMEKRDNRLQTGSGGGKKCKYDDSDEMILKIIGKDSPAIGGLQIPESSGSNEIQVSMPVFIAETPPAQRQIPIRRKSHPPRQSITEVDSSNDLLDLRKQKMEIDVEIAKEKLLIAKREKYKLDLELLKLEKELNLQPSEFTLPLYLQNVRVIDVCNIQNEQIVQTTQSGAENERVSDVLQRAGNENL